MQQCCLPTCFVCSLPLVPSCNTPPPLLPPNWTSLGAKPSPRQLKTGQVLFRDVEIVNLSPQERRRAWENEHHGKREEPGWFTLFERQSEMQRASLKSGALYPALPQTTYFLSIPPTLLLKSHLHHHGMILVLNFEITINSLEDHGYSRNSHCG